MSEENVDIHHEIKRKIGTTDNVIKMWN